MSESTIGANFVVAFNASVVSAIQDRTLVRVFRDALFPRLLYRGEAPREVWPVNLGQSQTFSRASNLRPTTRPNPAGRDPSPKQWKVEQWDATAVQYTDSIDTHMPTNYTTLASIYLRNMHQLGLHAGQSLNRSVRDKLFNAYLAGNTNVRIGAVAGTTVPVVSLNGFTSKILNGRPQPVGVNNPLPIQITTGGVTTTFNVVGFTQDIPGDNIHSGVLTLDVAHTGVNARDLVLASNRSLVINSGGALTIDNIASTDQFTMADIRLAVSQLRTDNTPVHSDGTYHCHLDPISESQVFGDNEFQRLNQSIPDYVHYREFALAAIAGVTFYRNTEAPLSATVDQDPEFGFTFAGELTNTPPGNGVPVGIHRPIFTGADSIEEKFLDGSKYISEAGVIGKIGEFAIVNNGIQVMTEGIRLILRAPLDRLQQLTSATWEWSGDWPVPTDAGGTTSTQDFKRAVIVQHGA